jgi:alkyl hydroperoxide reductase subunit F
LEGGIQVLKPAIDLAGIVKHVTILEFASELNGDQVLIDRLNSLDNIEVVLNAKTNEICGSDKVTHLVYTDRKHDKEERINIEAVFIQIGLNSNSDWVKEDIKLSQYGEIEINDHGETSMEGVFAAGDVTTIPYKQIIIAMGEGSKAALGAFDYLIRH